MNRMKEVAELLGVELGEWFEIKNASDNTIIPAEFKITTDGCININGDDRSVRIVEILKGKYEIVKKSWTPKECEPYFYPTPVGVLYSSCTWDRNQNDLARQRNVGVYKTKEEAIAKAKELGWT